MFVFTVQGMSCQNCVRHATAAVLSQDAHARVEIRLNEQLIYIESRVELEKIRRAVEDEGYQVLKVEERP